MYIYINSFHRLVAILLCFNDYVSTFVHHNHTFKCKKSYIKKRNYVQNRADGEQQGHSIQEWFLGWLPIMHDQ